MSAFIKLNKQDAFITPYTAHKSYSYSTNQERIIAGVRYRLGTTGSKDYGVEKFYNSVKQLYYSNYSASIETGSFDNYHQSTLFFTRSLGEDVAIISIPQFLYGENIKPGTFEFSSGSSLNLIDDGEGNLISVSAESTSQTLSGSVSESILYTPVTQSVGYGVVIDPENLRLSSPITKPDATLERILWTGTLGDTPFYLSGGTVPTLEVSESVQLSKLVFSDPTTLTSIDPNAIQFQEHSGASKIDFYFVSASTEYSSSFTELYPAASIAAGEKIGDVFYSHGIITITREDLARRYQEETLREGAISWQGSHTIYEHTYNCRSNQSQLNFSQNPSTYSNTVESGSLNSNITGSEFQPYVTTVGLYNDANELIAIGKLGQPVPKSKHSDMTFAVKFDA